MDFRSGPARPAPVTRKSTMTKQNGNKDAPIRWRLYPWAKPYKSSSVIGTIFGPAFAGDPATSTIEPKPEWFPILERWLPGYKPPAQPDRWMLQHILTREPFNLRPDELDERLSIENVIALLRNNEPSEGAIGESIAGQAAAKASKAPRPGARTATMDDMSRRAIFVDRVGRLHGEGNSERKIQTILRNEGCDESRRQIRKALEEYQAKYPASAAHTSADHLEYAENVEHRTPGQAAGIGKLRGADERYDEDSD